MYEDNLIKFTAETTPSEPDSDLCALTSLSFEGGGKENRSLFIQTHSWRESHWPLAFTRFNSTVYLLPWTLWENSCFFLWVSWMSSPELVGTEQNNLWDRYSSQTKQPDTVFQFTNDSSSTFIFETIPFFLLPFLVHFRAPCILFPL